MAEITIVTDGEIDKIVNVSSSVGAKGINHQNDVMAVKAYLWFVSQGLPDIAPRGGVPLPYDGTVSNVSQAIRNFQRFVNKIQQEAGGYTVSVDGRISAMRGERRTVSGRRIWTIFALNYYAELYARNIGKPSAFDAIVEIFPHLRLLFSGLSDETE